MNKLIRSCIIVLGVFLILAVTKITQSQTVEFGFSVPGFKMLIDQGPYDRYGYDCYGYDRYGYDRHGYDRDRNQRRERHDYDRDDHHRGDRDDRYDKDRNRNERHDKGNYKHRH